MVLPLMGSLLGSSEKPTGSLLLMPSKEWIIWDLADAFFCALLSPSPKYTGVGSLSLPQGIFPTQESTRGFLHCRWTERPGCFRDLISITENYTPHSSTLQLP